MEIFVCLEGDNVCMVGWWGATPWCCRVMPEAHTVVSQWLKSLMEEAGGFW